MPIVSKSLLDYLRTLENDDGFDRYVDPIFYHDIDADALKQISLHNILRNILMKIDSVPLGSSVPYFEIYEVPTNRDTLKIVLTSRFTTTDELLLFTLNGDTNDAHYHMNYWFLATTPANNYANARILGFSATSSDPAGVYMTNEITIHGVNRSDKFKTVVNRFAGYHYGLGFFGTLICAWDGMDPITNIHITPAGGDFDEGCSLLVSALDT